MENRWRALQAQFKNSIPYVAFKERRKAIERRVKLPRYLGSDFQCPVCETGLRAFKPVWRSYARKAKEMGYIYPLDAIETFNYEAYTCPACDASDRERLFALFLDAEFRKLDPTRRYRLIEFAPSGGLQARLRNYPFIAHRGADLYRKSVDDRIDITDMRAYAAGSVDIFLCSHILEHVREDRKAMAELHRVLKPGGFGIVMVPLIIGLDETQEDPANSTPELQWKYYGQDDHVRQYGKRDLIERLKAAGFIVEALGSSHFGADVFRRHGIAENSVLYVVRKDAGG